MVKITCPNCQQKYQLDESKIPPQMSAAKCKACGHSIPLVASRAERLASRSQTSKISCPNCQRTYDIDQSKIPPEMIAAKCKPCGHYIPLKLTPPESSPEESGIGKEPHFQRQPQYKKPSQAQDLPTQLSQPRRQSPPPSSKKRWVLTAVAAVIVVAVVAVVLGRDSIQEYWGRWTTREAAKTPPPPVARTVSEVQPFLGMNVNVPLFLEALEKRVPQEKKDLRYQMTVTTLKSLQLQRLQLFLFPDPKHSTLPVLLIQSKDSQSLESFFSGAGPFNPLVERMANGSFQLKKEAFAEANKDNFPVELYRIWLLENGAVMGPQSLFQTGEQGERKLLTSRVARFAASIETPQDLAVLAIRIPENIQEGWEKKIQDHPALEGNPQAAMLTRMGTGIMSQLTEPFKEIESLAIGFRFSGEKGRSMRYAQQFRKEVNGAKVYQQLNSGTWEEMDVDGIVINMVKVLQDERFNSKVEFENNRLALEFNWSEKNDQAIFAALSNAAIGPLVAQGIEMEPTEGTVETQYTDEVQLMASVNANKLKANIPRALKQSLFPGHFWDSGDEPHMTLKCDPVDIPNAAMAELTYEVMAVESVAGKSLLRKEENKFKQTIRPGDSFPGNISLNVWKGTPGEALGKARIRFDLSLPVELGIVEFKAGEPRGSVKKSKGLQVKLGRLEKDVAKVTYSGGKSARLFAFDKTGRPLALRQSMGSSSSMSTRFQGVIDKLKVVLVMERLQYPFEVEVDLNGGKELSLSHKPEIPVRLRYDRSPIRTYANYTEKDLTNLEVKWIEDPERSWEDGLSVTLPKGPFKAHTSWEVHFFGKDKPLLLSGNSSWSGKSVGFSVKQGELKKANAAFGVTRLKLNADIKRLSFDKKTNAKPVEQKLPSGQKVAVIFDKNAVGFSAAKGTVIQYMAYDSKGRRLRDDDFFGNKDGKRMVYYWGQPVKFVIDVATKSIETVIPFDIKQRQVDQAAYGAFKKDVKIHREVVKTLKEIGQARNRYHSSYGEDLAGLYYLYNKKNKKPMRLINKVVAHSDPAGQARFGYGLEPYKGYYFTVLSGTEANGVKKNYKRQAKKKTFFWEKGTFTALPLTRQPDLVAIPEDETQPTFFLQWNRVYMKQLNGSKLKYLPQNHHNSGWVEAKFIGT